MKSFVGITMRKVLFTVIVIVVSCQSPNPAANGKTIGAKSAKSVESDYVYHPPLPANIDDDFTVFIKYFSKDSLFQVSRVAFPLKTKEYDVVHDSTITKIIDRNNFIKMDFTIRDVTKKTDNWEQEIKVSGNKAKIEIRGLENGIMVDVFFEKREGKWMLITWNDQST